MKTEDYFQKLALEYKPEDMSKKGCVAELQEEIDKLMEELVDNLQKPLPLKDYCEKYNRMMLLTKQLAEKKMMRKI